MINSMNELPVEQLIDIMRRLDQSSLKTAILTCQKWREVIQTHCTWPISLHNSWFPNLNVQHLQATNRKFQFKLSVLHMVPDDIEMYKRIGCRVTELIWTAGLYNSLYFLECLKYFPNVEYLVVRFVRIPEVSDNCEVPDLKKLKHLETTACYENIYKCFRTSNIKSLKIKKMDITSQHVVNFIRCQKNLTKLAVLEVNCRNTFVQQLYHATPNGTIPFRLTHLIIHVCQVTRTRDYGKFIKMHSETLRKLELLGKFPKAFYEIIFGELRNLKFLRICLPEEIEFGESLNENISIENLTLVDIDLSPLALSKLFERLPNIKNLSLYGFYQTGLLQIVSTALNNVTTLCVDRFDKGFNEIIFPNLTSFYIETLGCDFDCTAFSKNNSGVIEIVIRDAALRGLNLTAIEMITRNFKLQKLKIIERFSVDERFLRIIRKNCSELKVLELNKFCGINNLGWTGGPATQLRLCDEIEFPSRLSITDL